MRRVAVVAGAAACGALAWAGGVIVASNRPPNVTSEDTPPWLPADRAEGGWHAYHDALVASVRAAKPTLVFLGDSLSEGWRYDGLDVWLSDPLLHGAFTLGIGGDTTQNVLWRIAHGALDGIAPRLVVVMIGINDVGRYPKEQIARGIVAVAEATRAAQPHAALLLLGLLPRGADPHSPDRKSIAWINADLASRRFDARTRYRDIGGAFVDAAERQIPALFHPDQVHLTAEGYERFAHALDPLLRAPEAA